MSQELVINEKDNVMAKCDLSSEDAILEIKAFYSLIDNFKYQLYYESDGRDIYLLESHWFLDTKEGLDFKIYKVEPIEYIERNDFEDRKKRFENKINNNDIRVLKYNGYGKDVLLKCLNCNNEWQSTYNSILRYNKCPICNPKPVKEKKNKERKIMSEEEKLQKRISNYQYKVALKSNSSIQVLKYTGAKEEVKLKCLLCGHEWNYSRADHFIERCHCPICKQVKYEN